jgi:hypothetical protein
MKYISQVEMNMEYQQFQHACWTVPDNIYVKLQHMPNNKGFIVNGVWLFGLQKPSSRKILVMFEKIYPHLYIHEITYRHHKIICMDMDTKEKYVVHNFCRKKFIIK